MIIVQPDYQYRFTSENPPANLLQKRILQHYAEGRIAYLADLPGFGKVHDLGDPLLSALMEASSDLPALIADDDVCLHRLELKVMQKVHHHLLEAMNQKIDQAMNELLPPAA